METQSIFTINETSDMCRVMWECKYIWLMIITARQLSIIWKQNSQSELTNKNWIANHVNVGL